MPFATFTPDNGKDLLRLAGNGQLQIWDTVHDKPKLRLVGMPDSIGTPIAVAVSPCGSYAAIETREEKLYAWNLSMATPSAFGDLDPCVEGLGLGRRSTDIQLSRGGFYFAALSPERSKDAIVGQLSDEAKPSRVREAILLREAPFSCLFVLHHQLLALPALRSLEFRVTLKPKTYTQNLDPRLQTLNPKPLALIACCSLMSAGGVERRCAQCAVLHRRWDLVCRLRRPPIH